MIDFSKIGLVVCNLILFGFLYTDYQSLLSPSMTKKYDMEYSDKQDDIKQYVHLQSWYICSGYTNESKECQDRKQYLYNQYGYKFITSSYDPDKKETHDVIEQIVNNSEEFEQTPQKSISEKLTPNIVNSNNERKTIMEQMRQQENLDFSNTIRR